MIVLLPRLPGPAAESIVRRFLEHDPNTPTRFNPRKLPESIRFAPTGGSPINGYQLEELRTELENLARKHGFGKRIASQSRFPEFDADAAAWISQQRILNSSETLRDDVWSFFTAVLAPDIVRWRFGTAMHRYLGGIRNTFQRLWMRGNALDRGAKHPNRWGLLEELTEDALVQITERPAIGGDPALASAVGEAWLRAARHHGRAAMEPIMRKAVLRIRIQNEIRDLLDLPTDKLAKTLDNAFETPQIDAAQTSLYNECDSDNLRASMRRNRKRTKTADLNNQESAISLEEAAKKIRAETKRRRLLSPKSTAGLEKLQAGSTNLEDSELNALRFLLDRMTRLGVLPASTKQILLTIDALDSTSKDGCPGDGFYP